MSESVYRMVEESVDQCDSQSTNIFKLPVISTNSNEIKSSQTTNTISTTFENLILPRFENKISKDCRRTLVWNLELKQNQFKQQYRIYQIKNHLHLIHIDPPEVWNRTHLILVMSKIKDKTMQKMINEEITYIDSLNPDGF